MVLVDFAPVGVLGCFNVGHYPRIPGVLFVLPLQSRTFQTSLGSSFLEIAEQPLDRFFPVFLDFWATTPIPLRHPFD